MTTDQFQEHVLEELKQLGDRMRELELKFSKAIGIVAGVTAVCTTLACIAGLVIGFIR